MNKVILVGRLTRNPEVNWTQNDVCVARYTLAVDRKYKREDGPSADFISCVTFGKSAEFAEKYLHKGLKIGATGRIETGSYINNDGEKRYTTTVIVEEHEFVESKSASQQYATTQASVQGESTSPEGFAEIDEDIPF